MSKYEFVYSDTITVGSDYAKLTRIRATRSIHRHGVAVGTLGGYIQSGANLSQDGDCWVGGEAKVYNSRGDSHYSFVTGSALVSGNANLHSSSVSDNAVVTDDVMLAYSTISENARVTGKSRVKHGAFVSGNALVTDNAWVSSDSLVWENAVISGKSTVRDSKVFGNAKVTGDAVVEKSSLAGDVVVEGKTKIAETVRYKNSDYSSFKGALIGSLVGLGGVFMFPTVFGIVASIFVGLTVSVIVENS